MNGASTRGSNTGSMDAGRASTPGSMDAGGIDAGVH